MSSIQKIKTVRREVTTGYKCDYEFCEKEVEVDDTQVHSWHHFSISHGGWGNDSIDSLERYDVCCADHYMRVIQKILEDFEGYKDAECDIDGMGWYFAKDLLDIYLLSRTEEKP